MEERKLELPGVEFEGPMGAFWSMDEVPFEALIKGICEIIEELLRRDYKTPIVLEMIKTEMQARTK